MIPRDVPPVDVPRIYAIADQTTHGGGRLPEVVSALAEAGVRWIQVRVKRASGKEAYLWTERCVRLLEGSETALWVNDRADVASLLPVYGVHVGQDDLPPEAVRRVVGPALRIGRSTHDEAQFLSAAADPEVDVVALGPIFATRTKQRPDEVVGLEKLEHLRSKTDKPLVAIGGIAAASLGRVLEAGADAVAMVGALGDRSSTLSEISANARRLLGAAS